MENQNTAFSRGDFVAEVTRYYEFLASIYLPVSAIKRPPRNGWEELTPQYLACLKKNDTVIDIIRHLPFIQRDEYYEPYQIYESTSAVDFTGKFLKEEFTTENPNPSIAEPLEEQSKIPAHVLTLATTAEGRNGFYIFLDTQRTTVVLADFQVGTKSTELSLTAENEDDHWSDQATYTVPGFFEHLKEQFRTYQVIAINEKEVIQGDPTDPSTQTMKEIYEESGVFTSSYDKNKCMERVKEVPQ